jgi:hypothetical protein
VRTNKKEAEGLTLQPPDLVYRMLKKLKSASLDPLKSDENELTDGSYPGETVHRLYFS